MQQKRYLDSVIPIPKKSSPAKSLYRRPSHEDLIEVLGEKDDGLARSVQKNGKAVTDLLMQGESKFGTVSKERREYEQVNENDQENQVGLSQGQGQGQSEGKGPAHPLLSKSQKYGGQAPSNSSIPANDPKLYKKLLDTINEAVKNDPQLALQLSPELAAKLDNQKRLENNLKSTPRLVLK